MVRFNLLLAFILLLTAQPVFAEDIYKYEPTVVDLTGKLETKVFYGPPGYGEDPKTDSKETAAILLLAKPITVVAEEKDEFNETRATVKEVQIINLIDLDLSPYYHKSVKVTGKLSSSITGHHHTPVLIEIDKIQLQK
jgi:hypothetical protein